MKFQLILDRAAEESVVVTVGCESALTDRLRELVEGESAFERLALQSEDGLHFLSYYEIECIGVVDRKVYAIGNDGRRYRSGQRLSELEAQAPSGFIRVNKSAIVRESAIVRFAATFSGGIDVYLSSGHHEYVSRRCYAEIKRRWANK